MHPQAAYEELLKRSRERALLSSCLELLSWDELTYMPRGGVLHRGRQMAYLAGLLHDAATDPQLDELLGIAEGLDAEAGSAAAVNIRRWRWNFARLSKLPRALVSELADVTTTAQQVWSDARHNDDFAEFLPWLQRVLQLKQGEARCLASNDDLYDALLQDYEPGATSAQLRVLFDELRTALTTILTGATSGARRRRPAFLRREFPVDRQRILTETVAGVVGFDFDRGRIDTTAHPFFSPIGPGDCRLSTRYTSTDFCEAFFAMLHELGHGLYEQGLDPELTGTPMGEAPSLGLHESQSRLWENGVGRSAPFWRFFYPRVQSLFHDVLHDVEQAEFLAAVNFIEPGSNRVRADAVTYDLHVMLRCDLEQALLAGELAAADLPGAWREKSLEYLGVAPANDAEGCLQDGHWSAGQIGYFPTYTLGNVYAAQFLEAARRELTDLDRQIEEGEFGPLRNWLQARVYSQGQRLTAAALLAEVTGRSPDCSALVADLQARVREQPAARARRSTLRR